MAAAEADRATTLLDEGAHVVLFPVILQHRPDVGEEAPDEVGAQLEDHRLLHLTRPDDREAHPGAGR